MEPTKPNQNQELDLRDYWFILRRRWRLIGLIATLIVLSGGLWTILQSPMYRGVATVLLEDDKASQLYMLEGLSNFGGAIPVETEMEILKSRTIAEEVVTELGLDATTVKAPLGTRLRVTGYRSSTYLPEDTPEFRVKLLDASHYVAFDEDDKELGRGTIGKPFVTQEVEWTLDLTAPTDVKQVRFRKVPFDKAVALLQENTTVREVGKKTNVIAVTIDAPDPYAVREIADKVMEAYLAYNVARKSQVATQTLDFIGQQLDAIRGNLESGEQELGEYKSRLGIFVLSDSAKNIIEQISKLETAKADFELQERAVASLLSALERAGERDGPYMLGQVSMPDPVVGTLVSELSKSLIELRGLRQDLSDENQKVVILKAQIDESKTKVRLAVENARRSLATRTATIRKLIIGYEDRLKKLPENERQLATLTRKSEVNAELYTFLLKKHEEARITRAGIVGNVRVLDAALIPDRPETPKKKRNIVLFLILGLFAGVSCAFLLEYLDDTLKSIDDISNVLGLGVYGVVPFVQQDNDAPVFIDRLDPRTGVQEAFRSLRTNIQFTDVEHSIRSIVAASALPGVGKSTTIVNLGVALAQGGSRVLVVDCDLRRPQVHRFFGLPSEPGLTNGLLTDIGWRKCVMDTGIERLSILPAGVVPPNPAEFLGSGRFQEFMHGASEVYDYVLYDVPPIVAFTDAALVAARTDAVFLVLELGRSQVPLLKRALELLGNVQAKVRGAIVNKAGVLGANDHAYGYSYGYYHYYDEETAPQQTTLSKIWSRIVR